MTGGLMLAFLVTLFGFLALTGAGTFPWALHVAASSACLACLLFRRARPTAFPKSLIFASMALLAFLVLTIIPIPMKITQAVAARRAGQNMKVHDAQVEAQDLNLPARMASSFSITRNRAGTVRTLLMIMAAMAAAGLSARLPAGRKEKLLKILVALTALLALLGFLSQWIVPQGKTLWWLVRVPHGNPVGCFLNRNHFAGFVAMLCPAALVLCTRAFAPLRPVSIAGWALCFLTLSFAVLMSLSRGAWLAYTAGGAVIALVYVCRRRYVIALSILLIFAAALWGATRLPHPRLRERIESLDEITETSSAALRTSAWRDSFRIFPGYALLGTGAEGFRMIFPQYRTASTRKSFTHAENEYVQMPVEFGLLGSLCIAVLVWTSGRAWVQRIRNTGPNALLDASVLGAVVVVSTHAILDYALRVPFYAIVLALLVGLILPTAPEPEPRRRGGIRSVSWPAIGLLLIGLLTATWGRAPYDMDSSDYIEQANVTELTTALTWAPTSWQAWYHLGRLALTENPNGGPAFAESCITRAAEYDPRNYRLLEALTRLRLSLGDKESAMESYRRLRELRSWKYIPELEPQGPTR